MTTVKRLGLDMDGVIADFVREYSSLAVRLGVPRARYMTADQCLTYRWATEQEGWPRHDEDLVWNHIKSTPNWWMTLPALVTNHEVGLLNSFMNEGGRLIFLTSRRASAVNPVGLSVIQQAAYWLEGLGLQVNHVENIIASQKKGDIIAGLDIDLFVDDSLDILDEVAAKAPKCKVIARRWPYNKRWELSVGSIGQLFTEYLW